MARLVLLVVAAAACDAGTPAPTPDTVDGGGWPVDGGAQRSDGSFDGGAPASPDGGGSRPVTIELTPQGSAWYDPEVIALAGEGLFTWQDERNRVWVSRVDPSTGRPVDSLAMGAGGAPLSRTFNGPEFGVDRRGWAIYFTQRAPDGGFVAVRSRLVDGGPVSDVLPIEGFFTPLASKDETAASTRLLGMQRGASGWGTALWVDLAQPSTLHPLYFVQARTDADLRWVNGTPFIISSTCALFPAELCLIDTGSGNSERISDGGGPFGAPYGWRAPEADAGLQALALVSDRELRLFRREPTGWVVIGSVRSPLADAGLANLGSPEPFVVGGRSYATLSVSAAADVTPGRTDQQIWVISLDPQRPLAVRCDDGLPGPRSRVDPEALVIGNRVFVYYYTISSASSQVSVCQLDLQ